MLLGYLCVLSSLSIEIFESNQVSERKTKGRETESRTETQTPKETEEARVKNISGK